MIWRWLLGLAVAAASVPAAALDFPQFEACTIEAGEAIAPIALTRFDRADGEAYFYASSEAGLLSKNAASLRIYFTHKADGGDWQLALVHDVWALDFVIPRDAVLVAGESRDNGNVLGKLEQTGDPSILRLDPARLVELAGDRTRLPVAFRKRASDGSLGLRRYTPTTLDIARLKSLLGWVRYLEIEGQAEGARCAKAAQNVLNVFDPREYTNCRLSSSASQYTATWYDRGYVRPQWQRRFFKWGYLNADRSFKIEQVRDALAADRVPGKPVILGPLVPVWISPDAYNIVDRAGLPQSEQRDLRIRLSKGGREIAYTTLEQSRMKWEQLEEFYTGPGDLSVSVLTGSGTVLETGTVPSGALLEGDQIVLDQIKELSGSLADPLEHCGLPPVIIVT